MRFSIPILFAIYLNLIVSALPLPTGRPPSVVEEGTIIRVKPKHMEDPGHHDSGYHPAVVTGYDQGTQLYDIAIISKKLPKDRYLHQKNVKDYYRDVRGNINVGTPDKINRGYTKTFHTGKDKLSAENYANLKVQINANCQDTTGPDGSCALNPQAASHKAPQRARNRGRRRKANNQQ